jgi:endonuclease I
VDDMGYDASPILGSSYDITGPAVYYYGSFKIEPRDATDVVWVADESAPAILHAAVMSDTTLLVTFSEEVEQLSAENSTNYSIDSLYVYAAALDTAKGDQVLLSVPVMSPAEYTLTISGVEDLYANIMVDVSHDFEVIDYSVPEGYYGTALGLTGDALKTALHEIIDGHVVLGYDFAWTAFRTTDDKPNGKVWDIYSDVPGGTPPYEYTFGVDEGGIGGVEGNGYTREHSWPKSWFGGNVSPMNSDLFALYPCDAHVNGNRGNNPYGEVASPDWVSLNGSRRGPCSYPGYSGIAFEPVDAYKGDLARTYFYMSTRYYTEDGGWPGSPMTTGAELRPWAIDMLLGWHVLDPVSWKEIQRNGTIYALQQNRNPFIDMPEFAGLMFQATGIDEAIAPQFALHQSTPNPFNATTDISFVVPSGTDVAELSIYSARGALLRRWTWLSPDPGLTTLSWDSTDRVGDQVASGVYFYRLEVDGSTDRRKMVLLR